MKFLYAALLTFTLITHAIATPLPATVKQALKRANIPQSGIALVVQQVGKTKPLVALNAQQSMNPASTIKLLTTFAALDLLGPAYHWKTEAYLDGDLKDGVLHGDLVLKGYGDPKFTIEQFWLWLVELRARGLREIRGNLVLDRRYFDLEPFDSGAFDDDPIRAYNVGADALLLNFNTLRLRYFPNGNKLNIVTEPPLDTVVFDNQLKARASGGCYGWDDTILVQPSGDTVVFQGGYPGDCGERTHNLSLMPHTRYVEAIFRSLWKQLGGTLLGKQRDGIIGDNAQLFSTHYSQSLSNTIRDINKYSNNVMARQVFLALGAATVPSQDEETDTLASPLTDESADLPPLSIERSIKTVNSWLKQQQLDFPELVLENGAGLSRIERISAAHLAQLLQRAAAHPLSAELQASLPILGIDGTMRKRLKESPATSHAHLKSGTLEGVKTLAGYVRSQNGSEWVIVFFINHPNAKYGKKTQDALIEWVRRQ
jgi:D-alanyl-D-alanine carboxypeptidase/D-alanyl-D-alanine-endopeptidase (penicillin-binding protein 4)